MKCSFPKNAMDVQRGAKLRGGLIPCVPPAKRRIVLRSGARLLHKLTVSQLLINNQFSSWVRAAHFSSMSLHRLWLPDIAKAPHKALMGVSAYKSAVEYPQGTFQCYQTVSPVPFPV